MRLFDNSIEASIINEVRNGHTTAVKILGVLQSQGKKVTKQALYQSLRKLKKEEVIVIFKKQISLSQIWIDRTIAFLESANHLNGGKIREPFLNLTENDSITYSFKTPYLTDQFWAHAFLLLVATTTPKHPVFIYNPHEWFMITRPLSEKALNAQIKTHGKTGLFLVGNISPIEIEVSKYFVDKHIQYHNSKTPLAENYYFNIFDDYILEVWLDKKIAKDIDAWYQKNTTLTPENKEELVTIVHKKGRNKMRISRNKKRALKLKKIFAKDFYLPK